MKLRLLAFAFALMLPLAAHARIPDCPRSPTTNSQKIACVVSSSFWTRHIAGSKRLAELSRIQSTYLSETSDTIANTLRAASLSRGRYLASVALWECTGTGAVGSCTDISSKTLYFCHNAQNKVFHLDSNVRNTCPTTAEAEENTAPPSKPK